MNPPDRMRRRIVQSLAGAALLPLPQVLRSAPSSAAVVETSYGRIRGADEGPIKVFRGIPYGADTATTRFRRPEAPKAWAGIRDTVTYGASCPQLPRPATAPRKLLLSWAIPQEQSEDCLFLNIWTPALRDGARRPVMVWIHGGGFATGTGARTVHEGNRLAEKGDVVVVTVNHRLNIFGHLYLAEAGEEFADSGNAGQLDLVAALKWIRDNIAEFGGDPDNVTVFGESGGGAKISTLLAMNEAKGLFHRAVIQSGPMLWASEMDSATQTGRIGLEVLGAASGKLSRLDSATTDDMLRALGAIRAKGRYRTLTPVVDGLSLSRHPFIPDAPAISADVPVMVGFNATESTLLLGFDDTLFSLGWEELPARLVSFVGDIDPSAIVAQYRDAFPDYSASDVFFDVTTMQMIGRSSMWIADRKSEQRAAPAYLYELTFETDVDDGKWRSPHTLDVPLVFDNVQKSVSQFEDTPGTQQVADAMSSAWLAFARDGDPNVPGRDTWSPWNSMQSTMVFDVDSKVIAAPRKVSAEILRDIPYWDITKPNDL